GVKRGTLQRKIRNGELAAFEGMIELDELLRSFPYARLDDNTMIERMEQIVERASNRARSRPNVLPATETLAARLAAVSRRLAGAETELDRYRTLTRSIENKLLELERSPHADADPALAEFRNWFYHTLESQSPSGIAAERFFVEDALLRMMAAHVRIRPSGHDFFVEGTDTLLDAGLRAGLALPYGCSNGACGQCKARVREGEVRKVRHHDYVFTESEKAQGYTLMCCHTALTDLIVETDEATRAADMPVQTIAARARKLEPLDEDTLLLHVRTPRTQRLRFLAGQRVAVSLDEGVRAVLPIASCPCDDMNLQFHIPRIPGDAFSDYAFHRLRPNDSIQLTGPEGEFVLDEQSPRSPLFIGWGTGFAPIKSLVEHAMSADSAERIDLYWFAPPDGHYLDNLCRSWSDVIDNLHYVPLTIARTGGLAGRRAVADGLERLLERHPDLSDSELYIAGPEPLIEATRQRLTRAGLAGQYLHADITQASPALATD
ncbi:MAG TPA: 2Fe-2S iron-sulfur cluster-binding protein, partial [Gammaproteobacteria bacterium]|nr:2Fe-2S iron-sulfur cluster-binding protein [Gammaproteobacteria bacterium]